jgi:hypothetical protein
MGSTVRLTSRNVINAASFKTQSENQFFGLLNDEVVLAQEIVGRHFVIGIAGFRPEGEIRSGLDA